MWKQSKCLLTDEWKNKMQYTQWCMQGAIQSVQLLSRVRLFVTSWTAACQASLSIINSQNLLKLLSIKSVRPSNYLILCCPLLLLPSMFPSIRVFTNESAKELTHICPPLQFNEIEVLWPWRKCILQCILISFCSPCHVVPRTNHSYYMSEIVLCFTVLNLSY